MTTLLASAPTLTRNWFRMINAWSSRWILLILQKVLERVLAGRMKPSWLIHSVSVYLHMYVMTCTSVGLHLHHVHCKQWIFLGNQAFIVANGLSATQIWPIACRVHMHRRIVPVANPVGNPTIWPVIWCLIQCKHVSGHKPFLCTFLQAEETAIDSPFATIVFI